jgi:hypothetical protein
MEWHYENGYTITPGGSWPNLEHVHLRGCTHVGTGCLIGLLAACPNIKSVTIARTAEADNPLDQTAVEAMKKLVKKPLQYLELTGFVLPADCLTLPILPSWIHWVELISEDGEGQGWRSKDGKVKKLRCIA